MMNKPGVTIIIPAYNEEEGILSVITKLKELPENYEILVVDDGSTDNTYKLATDTGAKVIRHPYNKGYGAALKTGIRNAEAEVVLFMDADGQHKPSDVQKLYQYIGEYDMVVGARTRKSKIPMLRRPGKKILSLTANYLSSVKIPDLNSGFRALKKSVALEFMHILPNTFSFSTTITLACINSGYNIKYVPIEAAERVGRSKIKPFRDGFNFLLFIFRVITYFNPLKVFLPIAFSLLVAALIVFICSLLLLDEILDATVVALFVAAIQIAVLGLLADALAKQREIK